MNALAAVYAEELDPREWGSEIPPALQVNAWQRIQCIPVQRWSAYLNALCVAMVEAQVGPWAESLPGARWVGAAGGGVTAGQWELVNGTALQVDGQRVVLIPTEQMDSAELRVPQEWVDIPTWSAPYYLGVQLDLEAGWLRVWCYATLSDLRQGEYDSQDRTYSLTNPHRDLAEFQLLQTLQPAPEVAPEPIEALPQAQARQLIQRLGNPQLRLPRLEVPFGLWAALLNSPTCCTQLIHQRLGIQPQIVRLKAWLQEAAGTNLDNLWQRLQPGPTPQPAMAWRSTPRAAAPQFAAMPAFETSRVKLLTLSPLDSTQADSTQADLTQADSTQADSTQANSTQADLTQARGESLPGANPSVALMVGVLPLEDGQIRIGIQVLPLQEQPSGLQVRLLDGHSQLVGQMEAEPGKLVQLQFSGGEGEQFQIEVKLANQAVTEWFEI
jgi:hypothetical protein